jgi:hypothetical protein
MRKFLKNFQLNFKNSSRMKNIFRCQQFVNGASSLCLPSITTPPYQPQTTLVEIDFTSILINFGKRSDR